MDFSGGSGQGSGQTQGGGPPVNSVLVEFSKINAETTCPMQGIVVQHRSNDNTASNTLFAFSEPGQYNIKFYSNVPVFGQGGNIATLDPGTFQGIQSIGQATQGVGSVMGCLTSGKGASGQQQQCMAPSGVERLQEPPGLHSTSQQQQVIGFGALPTGVEGLREQEPWFSKENCAKGHTTNENFQCNAGIMGQDDEDNGEETSTQLMNN